MLKNKKVLCVAFFAALLVGGSGLLAKGAYADDLNIPEGWDSNFYECVKDTYEDMITQGTVNHDNLPENFEDFDEEDFDKFLPKITDFWCNDYGIKDTLGLERMTRLEILNLAKNKIETIDLSKNQAIKYVQLWENNIEYLDLSTVSDSIVGLYLDDNVLVRTNFVAKQLEKGGDYYVSPSTDKGDRGRIFGPLSVATGLYAGESEIITEGAHYYRNSDKCLSKDAFCIIIDADILSYQNYIQLKYKGEADPNPGGFNDQTKLNYRLEVNLAAWQDDKKDDGAVIKVPDTGMFSEGNGGAIIVAASLGVLAMVTGGIHLVVYAVNRKRSTVKFNK